MRVDHRLSPEICAALEDGATVLTGNERAAQRIRRDFDLWNREHGLTAWKPPAVLSWDAWKSALWRSLLLSGSASGMLLNRTQEHAHWLTVLQNDPTLNSLRSLDSLAKMAAAALRLTCAYNAEKVLRSAFASADARAFRRWASEFERDCETMDWLPGASLEARLVLMIEAGQLTLPEQYFLLAGFETFTPSQNRLLQALRGRGAIFSELQPNPVPATPLLVEASDPGAEVRAAARWIRALLEDNPAARIAVLAPKLDERRWEIDRVFRQVLAPESNMIAAHPWQLPYEFSAGIPLSRTPMVTAAIDLLRWAREPLPLEAASALLLSRHFVSGPDERSSRAEFDLAILRRASLLRPEISIDQIHRLATDGRARHLKLHALQLHLQEMRAMQAQRFGASRQQTYAEWAETIRQYLKVCGWVEQSSPPSYDVQVRTRWESALDELATLDFLGQRVLFAGALEALSHIAGETLFSPESREAPVQILSPHEAAGCTFDAVWFLGAGDLDWPPAAQPNPLLPWQMQRDLGMPGADPLRDHSFACTLTQSIAASAAAAIFSYAIETPEGHQKASTALSGLSLRRTTAEELLSPEFAPAPVALEIVPDLPAIPPPPEGVVRGGARVLELQAACGFRAFAELRLGSSEPEDSSLGLDAGERGSLVHKALELFWRATVTQARLRHMPPAERDALLAGCIAQALQKASGQASGRWDAAYIDVQRERLTTLLRQWLDVELERPPFEVIEREKVLAGVAVGPLLLDIRLDRVDRSAGKTLLVDYKTDAAKPADWLSARPDAPQLPLYAIASSPRELGGVAFAQVRAGKDMGIAGFAESEDVLGKIARMDFASFSEQVEEWRTVLTQLAEAFYNGDAAVQPNRYPKTCDHCGQRLLCRLDLSTLEALEEDAEVNVE